MLCCVALCVCVSLLDPLNFPVFTTIVRWWRADLGTLPTQLPNWQKHWFFLSAVLEFSPLQARSRCLMSGGGAACGRKGVEGEGRVNEGDYELRAMFWYEGLLGGFQNMMLTWYRFDNTRSFILFFLVLWISLHHGLYPLAAKQGTRGAFH